MRTLVLLRGAMGCGKSTWIEQQGLKDYALSADDIRLLYKSPIILPNGQKSIDQSVNRLAWETLFNMLENRMSNGDFTIIDACNSKTQEMVKYKKLADKYRYRIYMVDFTDIPLETILERNNSRPELKRVPEEVVKNYYSRFRNQTIPSGIKLITRDNFWKEISYPKFNLNEYNVIHIIGDIHGCNTVLQEYLKNNGNLIESEYYVFVGDYIDRGIENVDVINFLCSIKDYNNVCLLEGNHEKHLWKWSNDEMVNSKKFNFETKIQLEDANIDKKNVRNLYRKLRQCLYFTYRDKDYFVSHGGISNYNVDDVILLSTYQLINGVGRYEDINEVYDNFELFSRTNLYQINGHRILIEEKEYNKSFNLCGNAEYGEFLKVLKLYKNDIDHEIVCLENKVFDKNLIKTKTQSIKSNIINENIESVKDLIDEMRSNKFIEEKTFNNISSFNFTRDAFFNKEWNNLTIKARGLFINTLNEEIVARGYNKFFNLNEIKETKLENLKDTLKFPLQAYVKYNGFLGLIGYNKESDSLIYCSKSVISGEYSNYFKTIFDNKYKDSLDYVKLKNDLRDTNNCLIFEVIDVKNDPHIIEYEENNVILLDVVNRDINFNQLNYSKLVEFSKMYGFECKELAMTINNYTDFKIWLNMVNDENYKYKDKYIEGFVVEDFNNFMFKIKLHYYSFWKDMRKYLTILKGKNISTSGLLTPLANDFYGYLKRLTINGYNGNDNIIYLRNKFYCDKYLNKEL
jgi:predicted kinase